MTFMCPMLDMMNRSYDNVCSLQIISKELHAEPKKVPSYYSADKYLSDVTLVTGIGKTEKLS